MKVIPTKRFAMKEATVLVPDIEEITEETIARMPVQFERDVVAALRRIDSEERKDTFVLFANLPLTDGQDSVWTSAYGAQHTVTPDNVLLAGPVSIFLTWIYHDPLAQAGVEQVPESRRLVCTPLTQIYQQYQADMMESAPDARARAVELSYRFSWEIEESIKRMVMRLNQDAADLRAGLAEIDRVRATVLRYRNPFK